MHSPSLPQYNTANLPWVIGASHYGNQFEGAFNCWISEVRISDHALGRNEFLNAQADSEE